MAYFGESGKPTRHKDGNAKSTSKYDDRGNVIEQAYFDESQACAGQERLRLAHDGL